MTQNIKPNDLVYVPSETSILHRVLFEDGNMTVEISENEFCIINTQGQKYYYETASWGIQPFVFLATPEMKEKLEQLYGELEDIPVDEELEDFINELNKLSSFYIKLKSSDGNFKASDKMEELKSIKNNLVQMFKERGSK